MTSTPLDLDSPRWGNLRHAYGSATDIPALLGHVAALPSSEASSETWFKLWSALAHQDSVYSASFAAVPHLIHALASDPSRASYDYFHLPVWIEICRTKQGLVVPEDLGAAYFAALALLPQLVAGAITRPWDESFLRCAVAAVAVAKGHVWFAEAALELSPDCAKNFLAWVTTQ